MNNRRVQVYLAGKTFRTNDEKLQNVIKNNHGGNSLIEVVRTPKTFSRKGLKTLMHQTQNKGVVYIFQDEFSEKAIKLATETQIPFWIVSMNNGGWTSTCINRFSRDKVAQVTAPSYSESHAPH
jgi:hypothetical protein